jgi:hypothetical protein
MGFGKKFGSEQVNFILTTGSRTTLRGYAG